MSILIIDYSKVIIMNKHLVPKLSTNSEKSLPRFFGFYTQTNS